MLLSSTSVKFRHVRLPHTQWKEDQYGTQVQIRGHAKLFWTPAFSSFITDAPSPSALIHEMEPGRTASPPASWGPWSDQRRDTPISPPPPLNFSLQTGRDSFCWPIAAEPHVSNEMAHFDPWWQHMRALKELSFYCGHMRVMQSHSSVNKSKVFFFPKPTDCFWNVGI